jgi:hypothetical protein
MRIVLPLRRDLSFAADAQRYTETSSV